MFVGMQFHTQNEYTIVHYNKNAKRRTWIVSALENLVAARLLMREQARARRNAIGLRHSGKTNARMKSSSWELNSFLCIIEKKSEFDLSIIQSILEWQIFVVNSS